VETTQLPFVDEHSITVSAPAGDVWRAAADALDGAFSGAAAAAYARAIGCEPVAASGPRPLTDGSTVPGFRVTTAVPGSSLVLEGRHRFSTYALILRIESTGPDQSILRAESRAAFPGVGGAAYRLLVIRTRGHVVATRRLLSGIKRRAEQPH